MITVTRCPICGADELDLEGKRFMSNPTFNVEVEGIEFAACAFVKYVHCRTCGVFIQSPRMADEHIAMYYKNSYRRWTGVPVEVMDKDEELRASQDAGMITKLIGIDHPLSHLDVGSGRGSLLRWVGAVSQVGVEMNATYNTNPSAIVYPTLENLYEDSEAGEFELVTAIHYLEHTTDPLYTFKMMAELSRKYVVVEVPSEESKGGWGRLAHTFHFPEETLMFMADQAGCEIKVIYHTPHTFVLMEKK